MTNTFAWANPKIADILGFKDKYINHKKSEYQKIKSLNVDPTFKNVVLAIENSDANYSDDLYKIALLSQVHPSKDIRDACQKTEVEVSNALVDVEYDTELYAVFKKYMDGNFKKEKKNLDSASIKLAEDAYKSYKRMGFELPKKSQDKLKSIIKSLNELNQKFSLNINNYQDHILCTRDELAGLPESYINSLSKDGDMYKITLAYPEVDPFLANADNREKRRELTVKNSMKGGKENLDLLKNLIDLRIQKAKLLGYKNYTDYKLDDKMAKNSQTVNKFVDGLISKIKKPAKLDIDSLAHHAQKIGISKMESYDIAYVSNKLKKEKWNIDSEMLREYFETDRVLSFMFETFENLLGIKIVRQSTKLWHKDVMHFTVIDAKSKKTLSHLLMDLYPRENKYSHAAAFDTQYNDEKVITLVCNFREPKGAGKNKTPSLMNLREVETIYHEFGHALHFMLYGGKYSSQNSFHVAWDFVELPSQMLENFIWNEKSLTKLSSHYKTGQPLNKTQIKNILDSRKFLEPMFVARQLAQTRMDLDIHTGKIKSYNKHFQKLSKEISGVVPVKESLFPAGFGHMAGYDSLYYSYLWALVYAEDVFSVFMENGVFSKQVGLRYRKEILEIGASRDESKTLQAFIMRKPSNTAFLKSIGVK